MIVAELTCRPRRMISIRPTTFSNISLGTKQSNQQKLPEITTSFYYLICPNIASCLPAADIQTNGFGERQVTGYHLDVQRKLRIQTDFVMGRR